jgi:hypothetical protein
MERERRSELSQAVGEVAARWAESGRYTHPAALIVRVHLWSVLHDRPTYWACDPDSWGQRTRPEAPPGQSTMSRRKRTKQGLRAVHGRGRRPPGGPPRRRCW